MMDSDLKLVLSFNCDGITVKYFQKRSKDGVYLEKEYLCATDSKNIELWHYTPPDDISGKPVWMGAAESTLDNKYVYVGQSNNRRLKIDPHTGEIVENIYQHT